MHTLIDHTAFSMPTLIKCRIGRFRTDLCRRLVGLSRPGRRSRRRVSTRPGLKPERQPHSERQKAGKDTSPTQNQLPYWRQARRNQSVIHDSGYNGRPSPAIQAVATLDVTVRWSRKSRSTAITAQKEQDRMWISAPLPVCCQSAVATSAPPGLCKTWLVAFNGIHHDNPRTNDKMPNTRTVRTTAAVPAKINARVGRCMTDSHCWCCHRGGTVNRLVCSGKAPIRKKFFRRESRTYNLIRLGIWTAPSS